MPFWLWRGSSQSCLPTSEQNGGGKQASEERGKEKPGFESENTQAFGSTQVWLWDLHQV